jgi:putative GTP pyrophosphokinase
LPILLISVSCKYKSVEHVSIMAFPEPPQSKSSIKKAGKRIAEGCESPADIALVDQWRASHGYALNTFQANLRQRIVRSSFDVDFVQRLKRRKTVIDKLRRRKPDGSKLISDVTSMQDFAGCRLIFDSVENLNEFRSKFHEDLNRRSQLHIIKNAPNKFNYIEEPKSTGYRGIHDTLIHRPRSHRRGSDANLPWHGLVVEVQYRTRIQNSWATAVEMSDMLAGTRTKFEFAEDTRGRFFALASEVLARDHEGLRRSFLERSTEELKIEINQLEAELKIIASLSALRKDEVTAQLGKHTVLNIVEDASDAAGYRLEVSIYPSGIKAISAANEAESDPNSLNAVYVRADNPAQLQRSYRNYFSDPADFVSLLGY